MIETFLPQCWQSIARWIAFVAPSWLGPYYKGDKRIRRRGAPDGKTECRAPEESQDKMARNLNTRASGVTHIMESGQITERNVLSAQVGGRSGIRPACQPTKARP